MRWYHLIERARVITLARRGDRLAGFATRYTEATGLDARPFFGFDGKRIPTPENWKTSAGAFGACLAHVATWARTLSDDDYNEETPLAFFEDDAVFCDNFRAKLDLICEILPNDWELLYLGGEHLMGRPEPKAVASALGVGGQVFRVLRAENVNRLHAYITKPRALRKMFLRLLAYLTNAPKTLGPSGDETCFDYEVGRMQEERAVIAYAVSPFLVGQGGFGSDTYETATNTDKTRYWN